MPGLLKTKVISGVFWRGLDQFGTQVIQLVVSIVLARLLLPKDFGIIALLGVFIAFAQVFVDSGFGSALVQKKTVCERDLCSVFYFNRENWWVFGEPRATFRPA
ncbi:MAG: oligosaccharide flippase family protein, partial [bacterium]